MDLGVFQQWLRAVPLDDASVCREQLAMLRTVRGILDAREMQIATRLDELQRPTEDDVASAAKSSPFHGARVRSRSTTCESLPQLGEALADGATTGDRIDVVGRALASLSPDDRARVVAHGDAIAAAAAELDDRRFRDWLTQLVRRVRVDDGRDRLARQRSAARLRWWNDGDGMWRLDGRFDPVSGAALQGRLRRATEALFADGTATADDAPSDPLDRQQWLQAQSPSPGGRQRSRCHRRRRCTPTPDSTRAASTCRSTPSADGHVSAPSHPSSSESTAYDSCSAAPPDSRVGPNVERSPCGIPPVRSATWPSSGATSTTCTRGNTEATPISTICYRCARDTITPCTKADGASHCSPIDASR